MNKYLFPFMLFAAMSLNAYEAGPSGRPAFGSSQRPVGQSSGHRSFTTSNNNWRQGVQTQTVQTSVAGSSAMEFEAPKPPTKVGKQAVQAPKPAAPAAQPTATATPTQPSSAPVAMPANMDPAAMMQQVQGMMQGMNNMMGAAGGQPAPAGQAANNAAAAMPAGMPDLSALMGGAMPTAPAAAPAPKK